MANGWCPFAKHLPRTTFGYPRGAAGQNRPVMFVCHIMEGYKRTMDEGDWMERAGVGVTAAVGRDGSLSQYTSIFDAHWGNGVAGSIQLYDRTHPRLAALEREGTWISVPSFPGRTGGFALVRAGVNVINSRSISIEHEGFPGDAWTPEMIATSVRFMRWCLDELTAAGMPMIVGPDMLAGHYQIDRVNRASCPGPNWPRDAMLVLLKEGEDGMTPEVKAILDNLYGAVMTTRRDLDELIITTRNVFAFALGHAQEASMHTGGTGTVDRMVTETLATLVARVGDVETRLRAVRGALED